MPPLLDKGHAWETFSEISPCKNSNIMIITTPTFIGILQRTKNWLKQHTKQVNMKTVLVK